MLAPAGGVIRVRHRAIIGAGQVADPTPTESPRSTPARIAPFKREHVTAGDLAEEAAHAEMNVLGRAAGKQQDHYTAAFGGITCFELESDGTVHVSPLGISTKTPHNLEENLLMFFTGSLGKTRCSMSGAPAPRMATRRCSPT